MSGIYIPGMEMPARCLACQLNYDSCACILTGSRYYKHGVEFDPEEGRLPDCPLIFVPPHGDLIDRDALMENAQYKGTHDIVNAWDIANAPTIIPAEEGE